MKLIALLLLVLFCTAQNVAELDDLAEEVMPIPEPSVEDGVLVLTGANFEQTLQKYTYLLVVFYDPYDNDS